MCNLLLLLKFLTCLFVEKFFLIGFIFSRLKCLDRISYLEACVNDKNPESYVEGNKICSNISTFEGGIYFLRLYNGLKIFEKF